MFIWTVSDALAGILIFLIITVIASRYAYQYVKQVFCKHLESHEYAGEKICNRCDKTLNS